MTDRTGDIEAFTILVHELIEKVRILEYEKEIRELRRLTASLTTGTVQGTVSLIQHGDTAWMLAATALVFFMTIPGLTLYYAGMASQKKNIMTIAMQSFSICCLVTIVWMFFGYSLAFSSNSPVIGDSSRFFLINLSTTGGHPLAPTIPEPLFCVFQLGFAVVTAALMCGASADRMKFNSMLLFVAIWHLLVYCPIAHSNWHDGGFLHQAGVLDWAGGNVVHISAGVSGLVTSLIVGRRSGYGQQRFAPNNMLHTITGACFLWVGWFGFNAGSSFAANMDAASSLLMTQIATSTAAFSWILMELIVTRQPTVLGMINGAVAGLVSITPAAGYVDATGAFFIGLLSGPVCYYGSSMKKSLGFDDALDAFGLHGIAGIYGEVMTGLFAVQGGGKGAFYGNGYQLAIQLYGVTCTVGWSLFMTFIILICITNTVGLRVSVTTEKTGLDRSLHGEGLYAERSKNATPSERVASLLKSYADAKAKQFEAVGPESKVQGPPTGTGPNGANNANTTDIQYVDNNLPGFREYCGSDDSSLTSSDVLDEEILQLPIFQIRNTSESKKEKRGGGGGGGGGGGCGGDEECKPSESPGRHRTLSNQIGHMVR